MWGFASSTSLDDTTSSTVKGGAAAAGRSKSGASSMGSCGLEEDKKIPLRLKLRDAYVAFCWRAALSARGAKSYGNLYV